MDPLQKYTKYSNLVQLFYVTIFNNDIIYIIEILIMNFLHEKNNDIWPILSFEIIYQKLKYLF